MTVSENYPTPYQETTGSLAVQPAEQVTLRHVFAAASHKLGGQEVRDGVTQSVMRHSGSKIDCAEITLYTDGGGQSHPTRLACIATQKNNGGTEKAPMSRYYVLGTPDGLHIYEQATEASHEEAESDGSFVSEAAARELLRFIDGLEPSPSQ